MPDFLDKLISDAQRRIRAGYYAVQEGVKHQPISFRAAIESAENNAIIAEIKPISPVRGPLRPNINPAAAAAMAEKGGATAISVLTEPDNFGGRLENLRRIRGGSNLPLLMKDIVIDGRQIQAGREYGADCVLLVESVFSRHRIGSLKDMINTAHESGLEVLLEVHDDDEMRRALESEADIIGVNNRNLTTLEIDLKTTERLMARIGNRADKVYVSESGFETADQIRELKPLAVDGFLIGSSIMLSEDVESKVREFVLA